MVRIKVLLDCNDRQGSICSVPVCSRAKNEEVKNAVVQNVNG